MLKWIGAVVALGVGGALSFAIVFSIYSIVPFSIAPEAVHRISYADLVAIMLTAVSIILAALGFVVALLAFIGWNSIGDKVSSLATQLFHQSLDEEGELRGIVQNSLREGGELYDLVQEEAKEIIYRSVEPVVADNGDDSYRED
ncbi:hypothetical protein NBRC116590_18070 [Pelagimonas sp. KU-00592-HH]|uniref:hypothetical protein n=1 Tax=Pelagimonas sp. KU-00592-HH TaxID=3127651 RepID=UPI00310AE664